MACRVRRLPGLAVQCTPVVCLPIPVSRSEVPSILVLPSPFFTETDTIRLLEPEDCDTQWVLRQVLSGAYDKPFVIDDGTTRTLTLREDMSAARAAALAYGDASLAGELVARNAIDDALFIPAGTVLVI